MNIAVAGTGYVGLVTGVCLASKGHTVTCVDNDVKKLQALKNGTAPIFEDGIEALMAQNADRIVYTDDYEKAYGAADVIFICVGTPERGDGYANLSYVYSVAGQIAKARRTDCTVVMKSTVPMGTCEKLERFLASLVKEPVHIDVVSNPEFLAQGTAVRDFLFGQRIVVGVRTAGAEALLKAVYRDFDQPVIVTDQYTAEMIKYASNNFLALKISFINEIANICELVGADVETVAYGMGLDKRIGDKFLKAGIGYGGSCFPKDTHALHWLAKYHDYELKTVKAAIEVNENQRIRLIKKIRRYYKCPEGLRIAILGLTFKPGTDDLREAASLMNIGILLEEGAQVRVWDPVGIDKVRAVYGDTIAYLTSIEETIKDTDVCLILTEWDEVLEFDLQKYAQLMAKPVVLDGRNCYDVLKAAEYGLIYDSIGRRCVMPDAG